MTADTGTAQDLVRALDEQIDALASAGELERLVELLAADFVYTHSTGQTQGRGEWLESLRPLAGRRQRLAHDAAVELHGDVAVTKGDLDIVWNDGRVALDRYVRVFRRQDGRWQAVSQRTFAAPDRHGPGTP